MVGEWVTSGQEAVDRVRAKCDLGRYYDFILIDWKMPDMDGIETTQRIRRIVGPDVTIIIISAYDWQSIEAEARAAGANLMISKPLLKSTLVSAFERALGEEGGRGPAAGVRLHRPAGPGGGGQRPQRRDRQEPAGEQAFHRGAGAQRHQGAGDVRQQSPWAITTPF
jgi:CheY-like chemotaxis protein